MRKFLCIMALVGCLLGFGVGNALAGFVSSLSLQGLGTMVGQYGGAYVGPIQGNITEYSQLGFICNDYSTTTYVPTSYEVYVGTLSPDGLSKAKFGPDSEYPYHFTNMTQAVNTYKEAAWLLGQMQPFVEAKDVTNVGEIQFAIWRLFDPLTPKDKGQAWLDRASKINLDTLDYSSVRIYTPTTSVNQEFMTGAAAPVPIPPTMLLLGAGLMGVGIMRKRIF
jgi:hypothetical protein